MTAERALTVLAFLLVLAAVVCLWRNYPSATFVLAASGAVSWFVGYRFRLRANFPVKDDDDEPNDTEQDEGNLRDDAK